MRRNVLLMLLSLLAAGRVVRAEERGWEIRGEFESLKTGTPGIAIFRLADGRRVELPLESLSEASQEAVRAAAQAMESSGADAAGAVVTVRGPFGRPVKVSVPESIKEIECDAIHCRSAADAAHVYRLALADERLTGEPRKAAEARLGEWVALADKGAVRLGERWVPPEEARAAAAEAAKVFDHAMGLLRLGNSDLAEEELRKAGRTDPESGRASFVMGLAYAFVANNPAKAADYFADVVRREPDNAAALVDLALAEILSRRYATAAEHFGAAVAVTPDPQQVVDNVAWVVRLAGEAKANPALSRARMPEKVVDEFNALYRMLTQDRGLKPPQGVPAPRFVGPDGVPCTATTLADVAKLFEVKAGELATRHALGFVVAPGHVVCPRRVLVDAAGGIRGAVTVQTAEEGSPRLPATVVAAPADGEVVLVKCEGLAADPLPMAPTLPEDREISVVDRAHDSWLAAGMKAVRGRVLTPADEMKTKGWFVHTAVVPRGLGGGPILDAGGRVVGMVAATPRTAASGNAAGFGVPVECLWPLLSEHLPDLEPVAGPPSGVVDPLKGPTVIVSVGVFSAANPGR